MRIDPFVIAIACSIALAYFFPALGSSDSRIPLSSINTIGMGLIFFFYGLKLHTSSLKSGLSNWKLHLLVQASTFILFPLLILSLYPLSRGTEYEVFWLGFLFLAALPSTVSSSVVLVSLAKGNIPAAIFNASISGLIGILITPLWMAPFMDGKQQDFDFTAIYSQLALSIILPLVLGFALQSFWGNWARKNQKTLSLMDKTIILSIIYQSFVHSFEEGLFQQVSAYDLCVILIGVLFLFYAVYGLTGLLCKVLNFNREDTITAQYCGSKKSLVHGTVFSKALFGTSSIAGLILLPLMLFHALQILIISTYANKASKTTASKDSE